MTDHVSAEQLEPMIDLDRTNVYDGCMPGLNVMDDPQKLKEYAATSSSKSEMIKRFGLTPKGSNQRTLQKLAIKYSIDLPTRGFNQNNKISDAEIFREDSTYTGTSKIKQKLYDLGVPEKCFECGQNDQWNGQKLVLQLEHINGISNDNRLENLAILCPNCHSQTVTYRGKSSRSQIKVLITSNTNASTYVTSPLAQSSQTSQNACACGTPIKTQGKTQCHTCATSKRYGTTYPPLDELIQMVKELGYVQTGAKLGVSDNAVRKHLRNNGIDPLPKKM